MTSPQRAAILEALEEAGRPLPPRAIAEAARMPPDATRKLLWKMVRDGDIVAAEGKYSHPRYERREASGAPDTVDAIDPTDPLRVGRGIMVYDAKTGGSMPWRNKVIEGPYE